MASRLSRRGFLASSAAGVACMASPVLASTQWEIHGSERGVLRLAFYTDIHAHTELGVPEALPMAAAAINDRTPDLAICGGDLIQGGFNSTAQRMAPHWEQYEAMMRSIAAEHRAVIGNHDLVGVRPDDGSEPAAAPRSEFERRLGLDRTYGSFEALGYRFLLLDSLCITDDEYLYRGCVPPEQIEWIKDELSAVPAGTPIVLVSHVPLLTGFFGVTRGATVQPKPNMVVVNNTEVLSLFAGRNLVLVLQGHLHVTEMLRWRGATFLTGGAISAGWWWGEHHGTDEGFNAITLRHDRIEWDYVAYGWDARPPK